MSATDLGVTALLLNKTVEFSLIALVALAAASILRERSAALRHWILSSAIACAAIAPLLGLVVPSWQLPVNTLAPLVGAGPVDRLVDPSVTMVSRGFQPIRTLAAPSNIATPSARVLGIAWATGVGINIAILCAGLWRLARVRSRSHPVRDPHWIAWLDDISRAYALRRPVLLLQSDDPTLLVTWGIVRPKVILPRAARQWNEDRVRVVLCHELAHVQRGDWLTQMAAELLRSIHWFNPLAWIVCRQLRHESEQATDDAVLNAGIEGGDYAAHLLDVARAVRRHVETWWPAPGIVRSSTLERRITAMLNTNVNRAPLTRSARLVTAAALFGLAAAIASAQGALATFSGAVLDPMNRTLPNVTLILTDVRSKAKHEVHSDSTGRFEFPELPRGEYSLEAKYPGFAALRGHVTIAAENVQQTLNLEIGTLQETVVVTPDGPPAKPADLERERSREEKRGQREREAMTCTGTPHGGNIRPPMKLTHVAPAYPLHLGQANIGGTVLMQALIAKDGTIKDVRVTSPAHPDLDAAALAAVRQWRFDSTLLNCMPVEVSMNVIVTFKTS